MTSRPSSDLQPPREKIPLSQQRAVVDQVRMEIAGANARRPSEREYVVACMMAAGNTLAWLEQRADLVKFVAAHEEEIRAAVKEMEAATQ